MLDLARSAESVLRVASGRDGRALRAGAIEVDNGHAPERREPLPGKHDDAVARPPAELIRRVLVEVDLARPRSPSVTSSRRRGSSRSREGARLAREERHARLVLPLVSILDGDRLDDRGRDAVDERRAAAAS